MIRHHTLRQQRPDVWTYPTHPVEQPHCSNTQHQLVTSWLIV